MKGRNRLKIGILTFHWADNYGAVLQAYALCQWISEHTMESVEIANYICEEPAKVYKPFNFSYKNIKSYIRGLLRCIKNFPKWRIRHKKFVSFRKLMPISKQIRKQQLLNALVDYDIWVTGSDQVWNIDIVGNDLEIYDLSFVKKGMRVSYAASSGILDQTNEKHKQLVAVIRNFDEISVREKSTQQFLNKYVNREVYQVVDPTLLLNKEKWLKLMPSNRLYKKPYVLIYAISYDKQLVDMSLKIAEILDMDIVICGDNIKELCHKAISFKSASPQEFLNLIFYSDFVIASSFHATVFSIIFEKQFVSILPSYASNRVLDLCKMAGCSDRVIDEGNQSIDLILKPIDYTQVMHNIESAVNYSKKYLMKIITKAKKYE